MSSSATILIRADALDHIESHPEEFVRDLVAALRTAIYERAHIEIRAGGFANAAMVLPIAHDDLPRVLLSHHGLLNDFRFVSTGAYTLAGQLPLFRERLAVAQEALGASEGAIQHIEQFTLKRAE